jgi:hypothetical protein
VPEVARTVGSRKLLATRPHNCSYQYNEGLMKRRVYIHICSHSSPIKLQIKRNNGLLSTLRSTSTSAKPPGVKSPPTTNKPPLKTDLKTKGGRLQRNTDGTVASNSEQTIKHDTKHAAVNTETQSRRTYHELKSLKSISRDMKSHLSVCCFKLNSMIDETKRSDVKIYSSSDTQNQAQLIVWFFVCHDKVNIWTLTIHLQRILPTRYGPSYTMVPLTHRSRHSRHVPR